MNCKLSFNQLRYGFPSPKIKRKFQLFRIAVNHRLCNLSRLPGQKGTFRWPSSLSRSKCSQTSFPIFLDPLPYGLTSNTEQLRDFHLSLPLLHHLQNLSTKVFLRDGGKCSGISHIHAFNITSLGKKCKLFYAPINK